MAMGVEACYERHWIAVQGIFCCDTEESQYTWSGVIHCSSESAKKAHQARAGYDIESQVRVSKRLYGLLMYKTR